MDEESTALRDIEGVNCIPALAQTSMEKLVENVSLVNMIIAGNPTATKRTKPTKCKVKVVKPDGLGIFRQKQEEVDESTHTLSARVATFFDACRSAVLVLSTLCRNMEAMVRAQDS